MQNLHWELSVLSRAVAYKNLSGAASNVGLSQPQLSRIISKIESNLNVVLLDRASRRNSSWTALAFKLAETYSRGAQQVEKDVRKVIGETEFRQVKIGTLEGLIPLAAEFSKKIFKVAAVEEVELDVHDLSRLEELFFKGELDFIFISREPGKKKFKYLTLLGHQSLNQVKTIQDTLVLSSFEHQTQISAFKSKNFTSTLISNSLAVRKHWLESYGGVGIIPSMVRKDRSNGDESQPVFLIGSDLISPALWKKVRMI